MDLFNLEEIYSLPLEPENKNKFDHWASQEGVVGYLEDDGIITEKES